MELGRTEIQVIIIDEADDQSNSMIIQQVDKYHFRGFLRKCPRSLSIVPN